MTRCRRQTLEYPYAGLLASTLSDHAHNDVACRNQAFHAAGQYALATTVARTDSIRADAIERPFFSVYVNHVATEAVTESQYGNAMIT